MHYVKTNILRLFGARMLSSIGRFAPGARRLLGARLAPVYRPLGFFAAGQDDEHQSFTRLVGTTTESAALAAAAAAAANGNGKTAMCSDETVQQRHPGGNSASKTYHSDI